MTRFAGTAVYGEWVQSAAISWTARTDDEGKCLITHHACGQIPRSLQVGSYYSSSQTSMESPRLLPRRLHPTSPSTPPYPSPIHPAPPRGSGSWPSSHIRPHCLEQYVRSIANITTPTAPSRRVDPRRVKDEFPSNIRAAVHKRDM